MLQASRSAMCDDPGYEEHMSMHRDGEHVLPDSAYVRKKHATYSAAKRKQLNANAIFSAGKY